MNSDVESGVKPQLIQSVIQIWAVPEILLNRMYSQIPHIDVDITSYVHVHALWRMA